MLKLYSCSLIAIASLIRSVCGDYLEEKYPATVIEDGKLDTMQLLQKYGYPAETHFITTEDKYILRMHRIPKPEGRPVLLVHGLLDSSSTWIMMGPWSGLGYYLSDLGYDVWLPNVRGNRYSRNHTNFYPDNDKSFWKFSWHEMGIYDLPAIVDYVLKTTGYEKLAYFGHSQGTTTFFVLCSMRPEYNDKILFMHALAPVAFLKHVKTPALRIFRNFVALSGDMVTEFLPHTDIFQQVCLRSKIAEDTCMDTYWQIMGKDTKNTNMTMLAVILGHLPAGCNIKQWTHYLQLVDADRFCQFNYGPVENMKRYGRLLPSDYPLSKISVPIGLNYALNDYLSSEIDVQRLARVLPNVVENNLYPYKDWNHMTMIWGPTAREVTHKRLVEIMRKYE